MICKGAKNPYKTDQGKKLNKYKNNKKNKIQPPIPLLILDQQFSGECWTLHSAKKLTNHRQWIDPIVKFTV